MHVVKMEDLPFSGRSFEFVGDDHDDAQISFFAYTGEPGSRVKLHRHPYAETFVVQEGIARFFTDVAEREVPAGQVVVVPAGMPHGFENVGEGPLRQLDIHANGHFETEWLED